MGIQSDIHGLTVGVIGVVVLCIALMVGFIILDAFGKATAKITNSTTIADNGKQALQTMSDFPDPADYLWIIPAVLGLFGLGGGYLYLKDNGLNFGSGRSV